MGRLRCDAIDAAAIIAAIGRGETTPLRAYQDYAATAARPYARASFEAYLQRHKQLGPSSQSGPATPPAPHTIDAAVDAESDAFLGRAPCGQDPCRHDGSRQRQSHRQGRLAFCP